MDYICILSICRLVLGVMVIPCWSALPCSNYKGTSPSSSPSWATWYLRASTCGWDVHLKVCACEEHNKATQLSATLKVSTWCGPGTQAVRQQCCSITVRVMAATGTCGSTPALSRHLLTHSSCFYSTRSPTACWLQQSVEPLRCVASAACLPCSPPDCSSCRIFQWSTSRLS